MGVIEAGLRFRIHFMQIRIQGFGKNADPDPTLDFKQFHPKS